MRKVVLTSSDFEMFDTDINSVEFEFFQKHKDAFKRMWIEQGKKFWIQFVITFRQFAVDYGAIKDFPAKSEQFEDFVDQAFIIIHNNFVDGKFGTARNLIMDIVMVAQNRHTLQYLESKSYAKDPFYNKETRDVFRRLFGTPSEKASYIKVYVLLPLYMKYGGAVCVCLRRWLDADDCVEDCSNCNLPRTNISGNNDKKTETNISEKCSGDATSSDQKKEYENNKSGNNFNVKENIELVKDSEKKETDHSDSASRTSDKNDKSKNKKDVNDMKVNSVNERDSPEPEKVNVTKSNTENQTNKNKSRRKKPQLETPENGVEAFKQLEVLSKDLVQSMHDHPFIKSSSIKVKLESGSGQEDQSSTFHSDGRVEHNTTCPDMDEAEAKFNAMMKMREEPIIHSDEFFKMYIAEITNGSVLGPVHVPGWPRNEDPRFFDSENPLYDPGSKKDEWKSNLKLGDFQEFVRYVLRNYKNGKKNQMVTLHTQFNLRDSPFSREVPLSSEEIERKKDQEKVAKTEEEKRKKLEEDRKRQKKIRKKLKKGLPVYKDPPSNLTSCNQKQYTGIASKCKDKEIADPRKPYIMDSKSKDEPDSPTDHESRFLDKKAEREHMEKEPNSVKLTKQVDEKAGTVSVIIEKRDQKGRLTKETTVKPLSDDGSIWEEAMKKINPTPAPPLLNDTVQKQLVEKLSKNNFFEESASENDSSDNVNNTSMCLQGDEMPEEDRRQFREMYNEISAAIADVSRQNQAEEDGKCTHFTCSHDTRHEKARNRLRRKIGERKQDRRNPNLPGLLRLGGTVEYPANEREAMMITLAEMTKMSPRERELFQERLGRTKYFKDCQEDPRDVADSMGAFLFPGMKKTLTDQKSQQKKEKVRAMEAKEEKEKQRKKSQTNLEEFSNKSSDKEDSNDNEELSMADVEKVIMYKDDVKRMKKELHYNHIKLNHMIEKQKKDNKEFVRTGREFDEQVRKASEDLKILEQKIALLDNECAGNDNPEFNANVMKAAEELRAVKKKVEKWEADADMLNEKLDKFEKEGDVNALLDGEGIDSVDDADKDTHSDKDELDYELSKRKRPIDQEKAFEDFKEVMGLKNFPFEDNKKDKNGKNTVNNKIDCSKSSAKSNHEKEKSSCHKNESKTKKKKKNSSTQSDEIVLEINERIADDFECNIPDCIGCKAPSGYAGGPPADLDGHSESCNGGMEENVTQKFIKDLDSGALPPPPPGVSITVLQRVTEPVGIKPNCAINMGTNNPKSKEFKSYWRAAKHYGPTPPDKMLDDPKHLNLINIANMGTAEEPKIQMSDFGAIPKLSRGQSPSRKKREKIQVKIARDKPPKREKTPSLTIEDVTEALKEEERKSSEKKESVEKTKTQESTAPIANEKSSKSEKSRQLKACSGCDKSEPYPKAFKKCQKCKVIGIKAARYYCGRDCQVSDWKKKHKQEHADNILE